MDTACSSSLVAIHWYAPGSVICSQRGVPAGGRWGDDGAAIDFVGLAAGTAADGRCKSVCGAAGSTGAPGWLCWAAIGRPAVGAFGAGGGVAGARGQPGWCVNGLAA